MKTVQPDIVVTSPDGEYLMIVEVNLNDSAMGNQDAIDQLKHFMVSISCSIGLIVSGERIFLLRDSLEKPNGESINVVGEARLPNSLLPLPDEHWRAESEFVSRVQQWLEKLKLNSNVEILPNDLRELFGESLISILQLGEVRAAGPRWSRVTQ